jgi:hypothetical protein
VSRQPEALSRGPEAQPGQANTDWAPTHNGALRHEIPANGPFWQLWATEMVSMIMSLLSLAAIIAILAAFDGVPQPDWGSRVSLTLNSLIAIISTLCRAMLMLVVAEGNVHLDLNVSEV